MGETHVIHVSPEAARLAAPFTSREERLMAARREPEPDLPLFDAVSLLVCLSYDRDGEVAAAARESLALLPAESVLAVVADPAAAPKVLDVLARLHGTDPAVAEAVTLHAATDPATVEFLAGPAAEEGSGAGEWEEDGEEAPAEEEEEETEEFRSKYQLAQTLGVADKIKMALTGDKEWRSILIRDSNKLVCSSVMKNPRLTEPEVINIVRGSVQSEEVMRLICANKEWVKNYQIRKALVENHKTPLANAIRYLATLGERDVAALAKSKNVSSVISTQARRILANKQLKR